MIEMMVAVAIAGICLLGLATSNVYNVRLAKMGELRTERAVASWSIAERLRAAPFDSVTTGTAVHGEYTVSWTAAADPGDPANRKLVQITIAGPGVTSSAANGAGYAENVTDSTVLVVSR